MNLIRAIATVGISTAMLGTTAYAQCSSSAKVATPDAHAPTASLASFSGKGDIVDTAVKAGSFKTLAAALQAADLVPALQGKGPFTVFAPTDAAFAKLPKGTVESLLKPENKSVLQSILLYHVVSGNVMAKDVVNLDNATTLNGQRVDIMARGGQVKVDGASVVKTDITCTNGVIHVIDSVILPSQDTIVGIAANQGSFNTLIAAVKAAGLADVLSGPGPFTVFAPTDAAFANLPAGTLESLLKPENIEQLKAILTYHVVPGRVYLRDAVAKGRLATVQGEMIRIPLEGGQIGVNEAGIQMANIEGTNGVIHVIDRVILPGS